MSGFVVEPFELNGKGVWIVISLDRSKILAVGDTAAEAVRSLIDNGGADQ